MAPCQNRLKVTVMKNSRRKVEVLVVSDIHLGTYGSKAHELLNYLHTVDPEILILNGDIIDIWQFSKRYFPKSHMKVRKYLTGLLTKGTRIFYVTGNHDEMLRRFVGFESVMKYKAGCAKKTNIRIPGVSTSQCVAQSSPGLTGFFCG